MLVNAICSSLKYPSSSSPKKYHSLPLIRSPNKNLGKLTILPITRRDLVILLAIFSNFQSYPFLTTVASAQQLSQIAQLSSATGGASEMRPRKESKRRSRPSSPVKDRTRVLSGYEERSPRSHTATPGVSLLDRDLVTEDITLLEELSISQERVNSSPNPNPRSFPYNVKQQCWEKAEKIKGRDPDRWRRDALGNIVFRKLVGCPGCLCHDYDHIVPYSKGGPSTLENCQVLQATVNRSKGNRTELSRSELIQKSSYCRVSGRDMDLLELSAYGNVRQPPQDSGGCRIQ